MSEEIKNSWKCGCSKEPYQEKLAEAEIKNKSGVEFGGEFALQPWLKTFQIEKKVVQKWKLDM